MIYESRSTTHLDRNELILVEAFGPGFSIEFSTNFYKLHIGLANSMGITDVSVKKKVLTNGDSRS